MYLNKQTFSLTLQVHSLYFTLISSISVDLVKFLYTGRLPSGHNPLTSGRLLSAQTCPGTAS